MDSSLSFFFIQDPLIELYSGNLSFKEFCFFWVFIHQFLVQGLLLGKHLSRKGFCVYGFNLLLRFPHLNFGHFLFLASLESYCDHWRIISSTITNLSGYTHKVLSGGIKLWDGFHHQFFVDLFCGNSSLDEIDRRGESFVCFFCESDEFVGCEAKSFGLCSELTTLA